MAIQAPNTPLFSYDAVIRRPEGLGGPLSAEQLLSALPFDVRQKLERVALQHDDIRSPLDNLVPHADGDGVQVELNAFRDPQVLARVAAALNAQVRLSKRETGDTSKNFISFPDLSSIKGGSKSGSSASTGVVASNGVSSEPFQMNSALNNPGGANFTSNGAASFDKNPFQGILDFTDNILDDLDAQIAKLMQSQDPNAEWPPAEGTEIDPETGEPITEPTASDPSGKPPEKEDDTSKELKLLQLQYLTSLRTQILTISTQMIQAQGSIATRIAGNFRPA